MVKDIVLPTFSSYFSRIGWVLPLIFAFSVPLQAYATAQEPDILKVNGKAFPLTTNPLGPYLEKHPESLPRSEIQSSARWRGYVATWKIVEQRLFLTEVNILVPSNRSKSNWSSANKNVLDSIFPKQRSVLADWYSGTLVVPTGRMNEYVHMGYASTYERYSLFTVREGVVEKELQLSRDEFLAYRKARYMSFSRTEEFKREREELRKSQAEEEVHMHAAMEKEGVAPWPAHSMSDEELDEFMFEFFTEKYLSMEILDNK